MVNYFKWATREIGSEYAGQKWPFRVKMFIDYYSHDGYLKLHMNVEELEHTIAHDEFAENFTAKTPEKIFKTLDKFAERATHIAEIGEDTRFPGAQGGDSALEFKRQLKDALHSEAYELMAMM